MFAMPCVSSYRNKPGIPIEAWRTFVVKKVLATVFMKIFTNFRTDVSPVVNKLRKMKILISVRLYESSNK